MISWIMRDYQFSLKAERTVDFRIRIQLVYRPQGNGPLVYVFKGETFINTSKL